MTISRIRTMFSRSSWLNSGNNHAITSGKRACGMTLAMTPTAPGRPRADPRAAASIPSMSRRKALWNAITASSGSAMSVTAQLFRGDSAQDADYAADERHLTSHALGDRCAPSLGRADIRSILMQVPRGAPCRATARLAAGLLWSVAIAAAEAGLSPAQGVARGPGARRQCSAGVPGGRPSIPSQARVHEPSPQVGCQRSRVRL
jgi:hypothetical protein